MREQGLVGSLFQSCVSPENMILPFYHYVL